MYRMKPYGKVECKKALDVKTSRLGIGFEKLDRDAFDPEKAYDKLGNIGVKWVRIQSGWQKTEKEKGVYDFAWLDSIVDNLISRGLIPWICVCYGNKIYGGMAEEYYGAVGCPPIHTEEQRTAWHNYCVALAERYRGRVAHFEVWNEPNNLGCWKHGVSATELGEFTIATSKALREGNRECYVIGGAVSWINVQYLNEAFKTGMADYIDAISYHFYSFDDHKLRPNISALRGIINLYNPKLEIIQGESGAPSRPFGNGAMKDGAWTEKKQCKFLLRHLVTDIGMGAKFSSYFSCMDMKEALMGRVDDKNSYKDFGYFGVLGAEFDEDGMATGNYPPKPSYYALSYLASLLEGDVESVELPIIVDLTHAPHLGSVRSLMYEDGIESFGFRLSNGSHAFAYWHPSNYLTTDFEHAVTLICAVPGDIHLVDPMDGTIYEIPQELVERDEFGGVRIRLLPIRDYPLFLVFGDIK
ncbi:MAG: hypothetical protein E7587_03100 [Ruminococcaceae bacterium]|nr:hypothetical protein [Oscillospiraceae bacterium]